MAKVQIASVVDSSKCSEEGRLFQSLTRGITSDNPHDNFLVVKMAAHRIVEAMPDTTDDNYDGRCAEIEKTAVVEPDGIFITV